MKALSLWQPWATLVAIGAKRVETRHWPAPQSLIGERIAIHATLTTDHLAICERHPFSSYIADPAELPLGAVVCTAVLARCAVQTEAGIRQLQHEQPDEHAFGYYMPGRFAWVLTDVQEVIPPEELRGGQGIWDLDIARRRRDDRVQQRLEL